MTTDVASPLKTRRCGRPARWRPARRLHFVVLALTLTLVASTAAVATAAPGVELCKLTVSDLADANVNGATVQIDGKVAGEAPMTIRLPAGEHLVIVQKPGFALFSRTLTLRAGHMEVLAPTLVPKKRGGGDSASDVRDAPAALGDPTPASKPTPKTPATPSGPPPATRSTTPAPNTTPAGAAPAITAMPATTATPAASPRVRPSAVIPAQPRPAATPSPGVAAPQPAPPEEAAPMAPADPNARKMELARGGRVLRFGAVVLDLGVGYPHYLHLQGTAGLVQSAALSIDAAIWVRSHLALTEGGLRMRMQLAGGGAFSAVAIGSIGGGGGLGGRDSVTGDFGVAGVMVVAERFALGARATVGFWSERLCPKTGSEADGDGAEVCEGKGDVAAAKALHANDLTERDVGFGLTLSATLEIALSRSTQVFFVADLAPGQAERAGYSGLFNDALLLRRDPGIAGRAGFSFVF